jgi:hypothetical protein
MNGLRDNLLDGQVWLRFLLMIGFWLVRIIVVWVIGVIALGQFLILLVTGERNDRLQSAGAMCGSYHLQITDYLTFVSDERPFPFTDFPDDSRPFDIESS